MVVTIAALSGVALLVADLAGVLLMRQYLMGRVDEQLRGQSRGLSRVVADRPFLAPGRTGPGLGGESRIYLFAADGTLRRSSPSGTAARPVLPAFTSIRAHADRAAFTVGGTDGNWRLRVTSVASEYGVNAVSIREVEAAQEQLTLINAGVTALVLLFIAVAAASVVRIGLRPLTRMERIAAEIAGGDLSRRVDDADPHTESGRLGMALNVMLDARGASERRLRRFLADASHELRTPLTSIQGFAELYRRGGAPPGPALDDAMARIEGEVGRMRLLVNDLLLLARLDEERPMQRHPVDLLAVAADAVRDAHVRVPSRFVALNGLNGETLEPVTLSGDEPRLRQVVTNLLANALQHTPPDCAVTVRVGSASHPPTATASAASSAVGEVSGPVAVIEVVDQGPGMAAADAEHAFERLYRADASRSREHGGAGLGLAIVAAIVQAHHGRVELLTDVGKGATFRVLLPV
jgi:two-component system OmpR family sensor kinase